MSEEQTIHETPEKPHSTEIGINAKGQWSGKIKCYAETPQESYNETIRLAEELEKKIKTKNKL